MPVYKNYKIKQGDTLERIALNNLGDPKEWTQLVKLNRLRAPFISDNPKDQLGAQEARLPLLHPLPAGSVTMNIDEYIQSGDLIKNFFYPGSRVFLENISGNYIQHYDIAKVKEYYEEDTIVLAPDNSNILVKKSTIEFESDYLENPSQPIYYNNTIPALQKLTPRELTEDDFANPVIIPIDGGTMLQESNGYMYSLNPENQTIQIIDAGSPENLGVIKTIALTEKPLCLYANKNFLYVAIDASPDKVIAYNISSPENATYVGVIMLNPEEVIQDIIANDNYLFIMGYYPVYSLGFTTTFPLQKAQFFVRIYDVSTNPVNNVRLNNKDYLIQSVAIATRVNLSILDFNLFFLDDEIFPTFRKVDVGAIDVYNDIIAIAINDRQTNFGKVFLFDMHNKDVIVPVLNSKNNNFFTIAGTPIDVKLSKTEVYVVTQNPNKLYIYDITNKNNPVSIKDGGIDLYGVPRSFSLDGGIIFIVGANFYQIFDVNNLPSVRQIGLHIEEDANISGVLSQNGNSFIMNGANNTSSLVYYNLSGQFIPRELGIESQAHVPTVFISPWVPSDLQESQYYFKYAFATPNGQTAASPHVTDQENNVIPFIVPEGRLFSVSAPDFWPENVYRINIFAGTNPSALWYQGYLSQDRPILLERKNGIITRPTFAVFNKPSISNTAAIGLRHAYSTGMFFTVHQDPDLLQTIVLKTGQIIHLNEIPSPASSNVMNNQQNTLFVDTLGTDIKIDDNGIIELAESGSGDLLTVSGISNVKQAIMSKILTPYNSIVTLPNYGNKSFAFIGDYYRPSFVSKIRGTVIECVLSDYRVNAISNIEISFNFEYGAIVINNLGITAALEGSEINFIPLPMNI